jgi:hypothetical protein
MEEIMDNIKNLFKGYSHSETLGEEFENRVFSKIKKKKLQKKITTSAIIVVIFTAFLFVAPTMIPHKAEKRVIAQPETFTKREIPLIEDVIFASFDGQTSYAIEQVAYSEDETTL